VDVPTTRNLTLWTERRLTPGSRRLLGLDTDNFSHHIPDQVRHPVSWLHPLARRTRRVWGSTHIWLGRRALRTTTGTSQLKPPLPQEGEGSSNPFKLQGSSQNQTTRCCGESQVKIDKTTLRTSTFQREDENSHGYHGHRQATSIGCCSTYTTRGSSGCSRSPGWLMTINVQYRLSLTRRKQIRAIQMAKALDELVAKLPSSLCIIFGAINNDYLDQGEEARRRASSRTAR